MHPEIAQLFDLTEQVALVTGGAAGIGRGVARRLAQAGAAVVIADRDGTRAARTAEELTQLGARTLAVPADVADEADVGAMVERAGNAFGRLDILVNNAGIFPSKRIADMSAQEWDRVIAVNLRSVFLCTRDAAHAMRAGGRGGRIVNIASIEAFKPSFSGVGHYTASKGGVTVFTKSAALEFAKAGITVNAVCPGAVLTEGTAGAFKGGLQALMEGRTPLQRVALPEEIGAAVLFFASRAASFITGTTLVVDGGYLLT